MAILSISFKLPLTFCKHMMFLASAEKQRVLLLLTAMLQLLVASRAVISSGVPTAKLNNGVEMPLILWGSGGSTQENATTTEAAVALALSGDVNFPGVDCANHYHNQQGVASGIAKSGKKADEVWVQTKVEPCGHSVVRNGHCHNDTLKAFEQNLKQLNMKVVDLTLIHSPPCVPNTTWADPQCYWSAECRINCIQAHHHCLLSQGRRANISPELQLQR